ncbi:hypothetical protein Trichorick_00213 [Candidatus Trichorickettsia mobilis]|uniref:Uncharacterized protein n=1 Tax=Candidatus Trichorickettsia mobilis TaxID=1346319 RepID=A0ABZ0US51_9RICK|nr:hypothetical protein [Candidatus Trichorickettsia mobilis]WPY00341.1 hypothetical protein Trichorick_00213 [Candidatus Trichorickettsia mobilis]
MRAFFEKIEVTNIDDIEDLFRDIFDHADALYGDFTFISARMIQYHYVQMQKNQETGREKAYKFLEQLILNTDLNRASIHYIKEELNIRLFEQLKDTPEQCSKIIANFVKKFEKHPEFENKIIDFRLISATQIIELLQIATEELINLLVNNEHIAINWLAVANTDNTPLCELAQMKDGCYQSQAMELYRAHPEWNNLVHENWIVELSGAGNKAVLD